MADRHSEVDTYDDPGMDSSGQGFVAESAGLQRLTRFGNWVRDLGVGLIGFAGMFAVAACAWGLSFMGLRKFAGEKMHVPVEWAWMVPIAIDVASFTASIVALGMSIKGESSWIARFIMITTTLGSAALNFSELNAPNDTTAAWAAAMMPVLAIVMAEMMIARARKMYDRARGLERQRITFARWVFDPKGTWKLMKAYTLGQELPEEMRAAAEQVAEEIAREQARTSRKRKPQPKQKQQRPAARPITPTATAKPAASPTPRPAAETSSPKPAATDAPATEASETAKADVTPATTSTDEVGGLDAEIVDFTKRRVIDEFPAEKQKVILAYERMRAQGIEKPGMNDVDRATGRPPNSYAKKVIPVYLERLEEAEAKAADAVNA